MEDLGGSLGSSRGAQGSPMGANGGPRGPQGAPKGDQGGTLGCRKGAQEEPKVNRGDHGGLGKALGHPWQSIKKKQQSRGSKSIVFIVSVEGPHMEMLILSRTESTNA